MKLNAARQPFSLTLFISALLLAVFAVRRFVMPYPAETASAAGMPLAEWLSGFSDANPGWNAAIFLLLAVWTPYVLIQLTVRYASAISRNYLPVTIFIIAACGVAVPGETIASYGAALLLALATRRFISSFRRDMRFEDSFLGGFYLGMIPLLYAPGAILLLSIPLLANLYRRQRRELAVGIIGALLPVAGTWFLSWASGKGGWFIFTEFWRSVSEYGGFTASGMPVTAFVCAGLAGLLAAIAVAWYLSNRKGMRTRQRKVMAHISLTLLLAALSLAAPGSSLPVLPLISVPVAMAIPYAFTGKQAFASSLVYFLLISTVLALNLLPLFGLPLP